MNLNIVSKAKPQLKEKHKLCIKYKYTSLRKHKRVGACYLTSDNCHVSPNIEISFSL